MHFYYRTWYGTFDFKRGGVFMKRYFVIVILEINVSALLWGGEVAKKQDPFIPKPTGSSTAHLEVVNLEEISLKSRFKDEKPLRSNESRQNTRQDDSKNGVLRDYYEDL